MNETELIEDYISQSTDLNDLAKILWLLLSDSFSVWEDGSLLRTRQLVERVKGLRIEIHVNEHPPPHFHVQTGNMEATFAIDDCSLLTGKLNPGSYRLVKWWHLRAKDKLITIWNQTRPTGCSVGGYRFKA
ncbi:DUF4160 domain-containing protein [Geothermobacter hydrogeniphilus]|uniref:DUF4160 domain-containing protein n=1 Tax=Geothermobacter hydrogeniphilus TaxID=1969733 RepID=UPI00155452E5|nr:DUF4160 domain-containing protein [Geothermobacter hydrogeniphilus]